MSACLAENWCDIEPVLEWAEEKVHARKAQTQMRERSYQIFAALVRERDRDQMAKAKY